MENKKLHVGQVWRKAGPFDWFRIVSFQLPDNPDYDGGLPGVLVQQRTWSGRYKKQTWFYPATSESDFIDRYIKNSCYYEAGAK